MGVGKFGQIGARVGSGGQVRMGQTDWVGMDDMASRLKWVCVQV